MHFREFTMAYLPQSTDNGGQIFRIVTILNFKFRSCGYVMYLFRLSIYRGNQEGIVIRPVLDNAEFNEL